MLQLQNDAHGRINNVFMCNIGRFTFFRNTNNNRDRFFQSIYLVMRLFWKQLTHVTVPPKYAIVYPYTASEIAM